jgi:polyhydroxyalkanoate synthesis regulator phasin
MIANDPKVFETGIFQTVEQRFEEQTKRVEELSRQIKEASKYVDEKFKILDIRMEESSEVLRNVASLRERISK